MKHFTLKNTSINFISIILVEKQHECNENKQQHQFGVNKKNNKKFNTTKSYQKL